ncbi:Phospholipid scramblase 1 [Halotydeus destructor]|nr:Phospholipid scramblase 1 [Halotydeus destructor]
MANVDVDFVNLSQPKGAPGIPMTMVYPNLNMASGHPGDGQMMTMPEIGANSFGGASVPYGLEYLTQVDQLLVHQKIELLEAILGCETNNKYEIKNNLGQPVFKAKEDTDCCTRQCCGPMRPFFMKITDNADNDVIHIHRPLRCSSCCFPCCLQEMDIVTPDGQMLGSLIQDWSICTPMYTVKDASGTDVLKIEGPCITCRCCSDVEFPIYALDGITQVGKITKQWSGLVREAFTDSDHFGVAFPLDLDTKIKAVLLGAVFLIDFMHFEQSGDSGGGM